MEEGFERYCRDVSVKENAGKLVDDHQDLKWSGQLFFQDLYDSVFAGNGTKTAQRLEKYQKDFSDNFADTCERAREENDYANRCSDPALRADLYKDLSLLSLAYAIDKMKDTEKPAGRRLLDLSRDCMSEAERSNPDIDLKDLKNIYFDTSVLYSSPGDIFLIDATPEAKTRSWQLFIRK